MTKDARVSKIKYYLGIAKEVASRSPCIRRRFGAVIVKNDRIISTGYNGTVRGALNCGIDIPCIKDAAKEPEYLSYEYCPAVHGEQNAVLYANPTDRIGATIYLAPAKGEGDRPCSKCRKAIIQGQLAKCVYISRDGSIKEENVEDWVAMEDRWMLDQLDRFNPNWKAEMLGNDPS